MKIVSEKIVLVTKNGEILLDLRTFVAKSMVIKKISSRKLYLLSNLLIFT